MNIFRKNGKADWLTIIPVIFWLSCIAIAIGKLFQTGNAIHLKDVLDAISSNTFSTYISLVICMAYQFFSIEKSSKQEESGLSRKYIPLTILATIAYAVIAIINVCRYNLLTTILMFLASFGYIFLYFKYMRSK